MNYYGLHARTLERRNGYISYLKGAEKIADFLTLIGATNSMLRFEDVRTSSNRSIELVAPISVKKSAIFSAPFK